MIILPKNIIFTVYFLFFILSVTKTQDISGVISDNKTGEKIAAAFIKIKELNKTTQSDSLGAFSFTNIPEGNYTMLASFIGYKYYLSKFRVGSENLILNINLIREPIEISSVKITGMRLNGSTDSIPARINSISNTFINSYPYISSDDVLNALPGIYAARDYGIFYKSGNIGMRGLNRNVHNLLLIDGIPFSLISGGAANWNRISPISIEKIVVSRGPGSYLYGGNAMGGIINIITKKPDKDFSALIRSFYGTYNTYGGAFNLMGKPAFTKNKFYWKLNGFYRKSDGYNLKKLTERTIYDIDAGLEEYFSGLTIGYSIDSFNLLETEYNYSYDSRSTGYKVYETDGCYNNYKTHLIRTRYNGSFGGFKTELNIFFKDENYYKQNEGVKKKTGKYTLYNTVNENIDKGLLFNIARKSSLKNKINLGLDLKGAYSTYSDIYHTSTDTVIYKGVLNSYSAFLIDEYSLTKQLNVYASLRMDNSVYDKGEFNVYSPSALSDSLLKYINTFNKSFSYALNPKLGLIYFIKPELKIYLSWSRGFRTSTLSDIYKSGEVDKGFKIPNPKLKPETIDNFETGITISNDFITYESAVYYSLGSDFQYFINTGDSMTTITDTKKAIIKRDNVSKVRIFGIENSITLKLNNSINILANYTFNNSTIKDYIGKGKFTNLNGKFLIETPQHILFAVAFWENRYFSFSIASKYISSQWIDDANTVQLPERLSFDCKIQKKLNKYFNSSITVQNLLDKTFYDSKGLLSPGRFLILEISFLL